MNFALRRKAIQTESFLIGDFSKTFSANLFYLTGIDSWPALLHRENNQEVLYIQKQTTREILFDGKAYDLDQIYSLSGVSDVREADLRSLNLRTPLNDQITIQILARLRSIKDKTEIRLMSEAAQISRRAHQEIAELVKPGASEWEIKYEFERLLFKRGARKVAYDTISGAGKNSILLHATKYDRILNSGESFVLDGACVLHNYSSDITSSWIFDATDLQHQILELVKESQAAAIQAVRIGTTLSVIHKAAEDILSERMLDLNLIKSKNEIKHLFPHNTSHWIGIEVHDPKQGSDDFNLPLEAGMTFTIEPGLYFAPTKDQDYGDLNYIGLRIEDDILVTPNGPKVLSQSGTSNL